MVVGRGTYIIFFLRGGVGVTVLSGWKQGGMKSHLIYLFGSSVLLYFCLFSSCTQLDKIIPLIEITTAGINSRGVIRILPNS